jgi:hypothetical protein
VLARSPNYIPALVSLARAQYGDTARGSFQSTMKRIGTPPAASQTLENNIGLATVYLLAGDTTRSRTYETRALLQADERSVRRLPWGYTAANFVLLARHLRLAYLRPSIVGLAVRLLDAGIRAQVNAETELDR